LNAVLQEAARHGLPPLLLATIAPASLWALLWWLTTRDALFVTTAAAVLGATAIGLLLSLCTSGATPFCGETGKETSRECATVGIAVPLQSPPQRSDCCDSFDNAVDVVENWSYNAADCGLDEGETLGTSLHSLLGPLVGSCINASVKLFATAVLAIAIYFV
jgi:hypothetical protein